HGKMIERELKDGRIGLAHPRLVRPPQSFEVLQRRVALENVRNVNRVGVGNEAQPIVGLQTTDELGHLKIFLKNFVEDRDKFFERQVLKNTTFGHKLKIFDRRHASGFKRLRNLVAPQVVNDVIRLQMRVPRQAVGQARNIKRQDDVAEVEEKS